MGQCSSSMRPSARLQPQEEQHTDRAESLTASALNRLRRRRSTDCMEQQFKRQRPVFHSGSDADASNSGNGTKEVESGGAASSQDQHKSSMVSSAANDSDRDSVSSISSISDPEPARPSQVSNRSHSPEAVFVEPSQLENPLPTLPQDRELHRDSEVVQAAAPVDEAAASLLDADMTPPLDPHTLSNSDMPSEDVEFFDAPSTLHALDAAADATASGDDTDRGVNRFTEFPPPPRTRPPPPPLPIIPPPPWANPSRNDRDDEDEQVTVLSRVLLAAATLTATHLVGEQISRGELYGGSNQSSIMQRRARMEIEARLRERMEPRQEESDSDFAQAANPFAMRGASNHSLREHRHSLTDEPSNEPSNEVDEPPATPGENENSEEAARSLSFPDFLEQLRSGRHSPELSQVMFDSNRATNFFRFFRFPEDREGRIPILLMGIRSAEGANNSPDDNSADNPDQFPESNTPATTNERLFSRDSESSLDLQLDAGEPRNTSMEDAPNNDFDLFDPQFSEPPVQSPFLRHNSEGPDDDDDTDGDDADTGMSDEDPIFGDHRHLHENESELLMGAFLDRLVGDTFSGRENSRRRPRTRTRTGFPRGDIFDTSDDDNFARRGRGLHSSSNSSGVDTPSDDDTRSQASRRNSRHRNHHSWVIYVIGGAYPATHPIFFAPSLLTDNPTYEDMLIVEQLLGPVKPPVASKDEVAAAGGLLTISADSPLLNERCPICLSDYAEGDSCRKLECGHLFHQECVDSWLTKSHNSCPMCRHEGVPAKHHVGPTNPTRPNFTAA